MKTLKITLSSIALLAITSIATAGRYDQDYTYAQVVDVQPIYESYQVPENRRVCDNNTRRNSSNVQHRSNGGGAILGGIIGGIIGNRFGKGHGRRAATAAGVIVGSAIGSNKKHNNNRYDRRSNSRACYTQRDYRVEQRITGYDVSYDYDGKIYQTVLQNHPGDRVRIQVSVQVAEY